MNKSKPATLRAGIVWQKVGSYKPGIAFQQLPDGQRFSFFGDGVVTKKLGVEL